MKLHISTIALWAFTATAALAQNSSTAVTGAIDASKNQTTATEAKEDTKAGNRQAVMPKNAGNDAAAQQPTKPSETKPSESPKPH